MPTLRDLTGQRFGDLTVLRRSVRQRARTRWDCLCVCGSEKSIVGEELTNGKTRSCGCLRRRKAEAEASWRDAARAERKRQAMRARRQANPEKEKSYAREYTSNNRTRINARTRAWCAENRAHYLASKRTAAARRRNAGCGVSSQEWAAIRERFGARCAYCLATGELQMDHVEPISRGGRHEINNVVPACPSCNASKKDKTLLRWTIDRGHA